MVASLSSSALISEVFSPACCPRLVVKIGSALLVDKAGHIRRDWLASVVADIAERRAAGQQVAIVSSGAIALGARVLGLAKGGRASLEDAQAAAATGQIGLSSAWAQLLHLSDCVAAQMLVTLDDLEDRRRYLNASATLDRLLALGVVPVINENDSVATEEIRFGDNDRLAARVGQAAAAQGVILLSDIDGLYTANPGVDPAATLVSEVRVVDARIRAMADGGSASGMGSGGMISKLEAARIAQGSGAHLAIVSGRFDHPLARFAETGIGTLFWGGEAKRGRKAWLAGRLTARGRIVVDAGAARALRDGRSLLAAGATDVQGLFARGDVIEISDAQGQLLARGLAEYDAADAARIVGRRSDAHGELLGYAPRTAMVHRDHMVLV
ncbi:glutamate 5-kinase [Sphingomonas sp. BIUV-7]|uniref:Glutamate 5-kinase n=1 Tax=Sphingomonas natans TaxID=3063330 RepID=A0ABT8Y8F6_9SPHN|nr:glutamate 5-kinase [Sphingomonas sp. BIUV-7]MDO6413970.1 glutamate 5-kinase [Sphingomonas sp. BIUV-7]